VVSFAGFGISLGTLFAADCTKRCKEIKKLILFAPFGDFAEHVMLWPKHRYFSKVLASQPTSREESGEVLNRIGIGKNVTELRHAQILICYAASDTTIHTAPTEKLLNDFYKNKVEVEVIKVGGNHLMGIFKGLFVKKPYIRFFN
jgi:hypothetical protein